MQVALLRSSPKIAFVACGSNLISPDGVDLGDIYRCHPITTGPKAWKALLAFNFITTPAVLAWRDRILAAGGFDEGLKIGEDQDLWIRLSQAGELGYVRRSLVRVHARHNSLSAEKKTDPMTYTLPMIRRHVAAARGRLSLIESRWIMGKRLGLLGRVAYAHGDYRNGFRLIGRSITLGYRPMEQSLLHGVGVAPGRVAEAAPEDRQAMVSLRARAKELAYRSGALAAWHARRNAKTLTVVMFHRVLPEPEMTASGADPLYTVTPRFLAECVTFLRKHYAIVRLDDVLNARNGSAPLPDNAVLITFDDGWRDNLRYASPALAEIPWTIFVSTDALSDPECWWQEVLLWSLRAGVATEEQLWRLAGGEPAFNGIDVSHALLMHLAALPANVRDDFLAPYRTMLREKTAGQMMLAPADLAILMRNGASIGVHGASHLPMSRLSPGDAEKELRSARDLVMAWTSSKNAPSMSFPHGSYSAPVVGAARAAGYPLMFTSDPVLNASNDGWLGGDLLGRIPIDLHDVADANGKLDPSRLATWLFLRDIRRPG